MTNQIKLTKSDFVTGYQCSKALWLNYYKPHLKSTVSDRLKSSAKTGKVINGLAQEYFKNYNCFNAYKENNNINDLAKITHQSITKNYEIVFEATAINDDNCNARIDILQKNGDCWNLIEVKSSTKKDIKYITDLAYQYYIFSQVGYKIDKCLLMLVNNEYVFNDNEIDLSKFFRFEDVTDDVIEQINKIELKKLELMAVINDKNEPLIKIGNHCFKPSDCNYRDYCWQNISPYSIFDVCNRKTTAEKIANDINSYKIEDIDLNNYKNGLKNFEIECYLQNLTYVNKEKLRNFLQKLAFPLYFLDYESVQLAIPKFKNSRPYQQIPFQFSLHVQKDLYSEPEHFEFLHDQKSDPRVNFIDNLLKYSGDKGSIIVYNKTFEKSVNKDLARDFVEYSKKLIDINNRIIDLMDPFKDRIVYSPKQQGSNSIKKVLPSFTDLNYNNLKIQKGDEAMNIYLDFIEGEEELDQENKNNLLEYCKMDSYAMFELLTKLRELSQ